MDSSIPNSALATTQEPIPALVGPHRVHVWVHGSYAGAYDHETLELASTERDERQAKYRRLGCYYEVEEATPRCPACHKQALEMSSRGQLRDMPVCDHLSPPIPDETSFSSPFWPCPHKCSTWCRDDLQIIAGKIRPTTNHHPRCEHVDKSLIDVWVVKYDGASCSFDHEPTPDDVPEGATVSKKRMHAEIFAQLEEFQGW